MSTRLTDQLNEYFTFIDEDQGAVDIRTAVLSRSDAVRAIAPVGDPIDDRRIPWKLVLAAVTSVLIVLLPLLLMVRSDSPDVVTSSPTTTSEAVPTTTTAATTATTTPAPEPTAVADPTEAPESGALDVLPSFFRWVSLEGDAETVPFGSLVATADGFLVAEATPGADPADQYLWASVDGEAWTRTSGLPQRAVRPMIVRAGDTIWLVSNGEDELAWILEPETDGWIEVDTTEIQPFDPGVVPYVDERGWQTTGQGLFGPSAENALVTNGEVVIGAWWDAGFQSVVVRSEGERFEAIEAPWPPASWTQLVASKGRFYAYTWAAFETQEDRGSIWVSDDGRSWDRAGPLPFGHAPDTGEPNQGFQVAERDGVLLAQVGYFCPVGDLWMSSDGVTWEHVGDSPDRGASCDGTLLARDRDWLFVTDRGNELTELNLFQSTDGQTWTDVTVLARDLAAAQLAKGDTPLGQFTVQTAADALVVQSVAGDRRSMWIGLPTEVVIIEDSACSSTPLEWTSPGPVEIDVENRTGRTAAVVIGRYAEGFERADLVAYGRDITTRPDFLEAIEIFQVQPDALATLGPLDLEPGAYGAVCMDTDSTMVVLPDLVVGAGGR